MAGRLLIAAASIALGGAAVPAVQNMQGSAVGQSMQFNRVPLNVMVETVLRRVSSKPFVICDKVLGDTRLVSLRLEPYQLKYSIVGQILGAYGYRLNDRAGVLYVCGTEDRGSASGSGGPASGGSAGPVAVSSGGTAPMGYSPAGVGGGGYEGARGVPLGSPLDPGPAPRTIAGEPTRDAVGGANPAGRPSSGMMGLEAYRPDYVAPSALKEAMQSAMPDVALSVVETPGQRPVLFARGDVEAVARFREMIAYLDVPTDAVEVQAIVLEVTDAKRTGFGVSVVLDALRSGLGAAIGTPALDNRLSFRSGSFEAVLSAVSGSSNVRVVSSPRLVGRSGETLRLQVGNDVPILGAVVENPLGSSQQSVQYRSSGVIFEVLPRVYGRRLALDVHQELSAFVTTETGVRGSPTLTKRELDTKVDLESGEWAVVGGLTTRDDGSQRSDLFGIPLGKSRALRSSELVLLVNVRRVERARSSAPTPARKGG
jgi:type II secretory pathway component GspD/PulD (secretin)